MLTFRSEEFRGAKLTLPLKVTTPSTFEWDWVMADGVETNFSIAFTSAEMSKQKLVVVGPVLASKHAGRAELEGVGEALIMWEQPAETGRQSWLFRGGDASLKYQIKMGSTSELRAEKERQQLVEAEKAAVLQAKVAELQNKAEEASQLSSLLRVQSAELSKNEEEQRLELDQHLAAYEEQKLRVEAENARLAELLPPLELARISFAEVKARHEDVTYRARDAEAWQRLHAEECEKYRSGEWVFMGWKGGGEP